MIQVEGLVKRFNPVEALSGLDFTARDGEVTGLIGPNGAGKTTALRILCTVMRPDEGIAQIDGFDTVGQRLDVQRRIGVLPDTRGLYPRLTAREHIRYFGRLHGMGGIELEGKINQLINILGMEEIADRRAKGFSKGQARKLSMARALVHDPQNLMLDEPTNGLDIATSRAVHDIIRRLKGRGRSILFCSHIMQEVVSIADRIVVIAAGRAVAHGTVEELYAQTGCDDIEEMFLMLTNGGGGTQAEKPVVA